MVAGAAPDGYTLLFAASSMITLTPQVQKLSFDPMKQLVPITNMGTGTQTLAIKRDLPAKTLPEFIAYAKAHPGKLNYTVAGTQNISHLAPVLLFARAGIDLAGDQRPAHQARNRSRRPLQRAERSRIQKGLGILRRGGEGRRHQAAAVGRRRGLSMLSRRQAAKPAACRNGRPRP
jgi:hypothetical protein